MTLQAPKHEFPKILLLGPLPPPYIGPAVATEIILKSRLKDYFTLIHLDTNLHTSVATLGNVSAGNIVRNILLYLKMISLMFRHRPLLTVIPISQTTRGFLKDSIFIFISKLFLGKTLLQLRGSNFRNWIGSSSGITKFYVARVLGIAQGIIVLGEKLRSLFIDYFPDNRIFVVPNGTDILPIQRMSEKAPKLNILYLGNLLKSKGIEDVISAGIYARENQALKEIEIHVAGDWGSDGLKETLIALVKRYSLPVFFHGPVNGNAKMGLLAKADLFIFPPREPEGHPWVIIEAMAAGLPIIATDQGAIAESVIDGVNGFIVEKKSPGQIEEKIKILIQNEELRKKMGRESRRLYEQNFTEEKMVQKLKDCFENVLAS